jgi:hypothetical protein
LIDLAQERQRRRPRQINRPPSEVPPEQSLRGQLALGDDRPMTENEAATTEAARAERERIEAREERAFRRWARENT